MDKDTVLYQLQNHSDIMSTGKVHPGVLVAGRS